jgi:hypothetical protein
MELSPAKRKASREWSGADGASEVVVALVKPGSRQPSDDVIDLTDCD